MSKPMADTPKRRPRRRFDDDFKAQAVRLVLDEGKSVGSVARDLDLTETALRECAMLRPVAKGGLTLGRLRAHPNIFDQTQLCSPTQAVESSEPTVDEIPTREI